MREVNAELAARVAAMVDEPIEDRLAAEARFYAREAAAMKPTEARHLGPQEAATIARLFTEASNALRARQQGGATNGRAADPATQDRRADR